MRNQLYYIAFGVVGLILVALGVWFFFFRSASPAQTINPDGSFGTPANTSTGTNGTNSASNGTQTINTSSSNTSQQKIFQITPGPVVGATLIQTLHPTTTLARYIKQEDGHVFDLPLDVAGAVPRVVSNVTIPGGQRALWVEGGRAALMQYIDSGIVKTVYLGFPEATTSPVVLPTRIQFLPDGIEDIASSPDGMSIVYLMKTAGGVDGYVTKDDGTSGKKIFSLPLSQILISWPSPNTLLAQTKSAAGIQGIAFSIDAKSGAVSLLVSAQGLTATADLSFAHIIYQTTQTNSVARSSYVHDVKTGTDRTLSFGAYPEKCIWSHTATSTMYCAAPIAYVAQNYLDLWHQGAASVADSIFLFQVNTGGGIILVTPGSNDGGAMSDILEMSLSPDERYLSFTTKGARTLWGVRLTQ